jgi:hypothetical protein
MSSVHTINGEFVAAFVKSLHMFVSWVRILNQGISWPGRAISRACDLNTRRVILQPQSQTPQHWKRPEHAAGLWIHLEQLGI